MNIKVLYSTDIYRRIVTSDINKKDDIYRYELMLPFKEKWDYYQIPLKPKTPQGYDIIIATTMLGIMSPTKIDETTIKQIDLMASSSLWHECEETIKNSLELFIKRDYHLPVQDYLFTMLLADEENIYIMMNNGYCGDGGIPGYIMTWLIPNEYTISHMASAVAHEVNHNVRFQYQKWHNDITLGEMIVSEGLAENFAEKVKGKELIGPWVLNTKLETLNNIIKPIISKHLDVKGLAEINAYLYGDDMAELQCLSGVGLPYCAGYACGYYLIKYFLEKTGIDIIDATIMDASCILNEAKDFWNIK